MADMPNFNALLMAGYNTGREVKRQQGLDNALAAYSANPDDPSSVAGIARYDPRTAIQIGTVQQKRQADLQEIQQKKLAEGKKAVGQAALLVAQQPEANRAAAWDQSIDYLVSQGYDGLAQFKGKYNPQSLQGVLSEAGLAGEYMSATKPSYMAIPEGGTLVNTRDTSAVAQFGVPQQSAPSPAPASGPAPITYQGPHLTAAQARSIGQGVNFLQWQKREGTPVLVTSPEEAASLPAGTIMVSPDGRQGVKR